MQAYVEPRTEYDRSPEQAYTGPTQKSEKRSEYTIQSGIDIGIRFDYTTLHDLITVRYLQTLFSDEISRVFF